MAFAAAEQLYVVQRAPSGVDERRNAPADPAWWQTLEPGWQHRRRGGVPPAEEWGGDTRDDATGLARASSGVMPGRR